MAFDPFKRHVPPAMTLAEKVARDTGMFPDAGKGFDIPFMIWYNKRSQDGYLIANQLRHITGVPHKFLVFWDLRFRGVIYYTNRGWVMEHHNPDLVYSLGEWIEIYYQ